MSKLPYCLFHKSALVEIVSSIGKPLKVDHETETQSRSAYAKICVEMNVPDPKLASVAIVMGDTCIEHKLIYENIPRYCVNCSHLGHDIKVCRWLKQEQGKMKGEEGGKDGQEAVIAKELEFNNTQ